MNGVRILRGVAIAALFFALAGGVAAQPATPDGELAVDALAGTAFSYQGRLLDGSAPANGPYDFRFQLFEAATGGSPVGPPFATDDLPVVNGNFVAYPDFGNAFDGQARWLETAVRPGASSGSFAVLSPRQAVLPAPYALALPGLWTQQRSGTPNLIGGYSGNVIGPDVGGATIGGGGAGFAVNAVTAYYGTVSGGIGNRVEQAAASVGGGSENVASGAAATVAGGIHNAAAGDEATVAGGHTNSASGRQSAVGGGTLNAASGPLTTVAGGERNRADGTVATVGGGSLNEANANGTTIAGGVMNTSEGVVSATGGGLNNRANGYISTIGGGEGNLANNAHTVVSGGTHNHATGDKSAVGGGNENRATGNFSVVAGGTQNQGTGNKSAVGGGQLNLASGMQSAIGGGFSNQATGEHATVPGGVRNVAAGESSFAAGRQAQAAFNGCFVWGDATVADVGCTAANQWIARAGGGVYFYTSSGLGSGVYVPAGGGSWSMITAANGTENLAVVDNQQILASLANMPITTWNYATQDQAIRHIGPTAQDFYAAFGVGEDPRSISTVDADGVALAAIQGLNELVQDQAAQLAAQQAQIDALEARLAASQPAGDAQGRPVTAGIALLIAGLVGSSTWAWSRRAGEVRDED